MSNDGLIVGTTAKRDGEVKSWLHEAKQFCCKVESNL